MVTWSPRRRASDNWPADVADPTQEAGRTLVWGPQRSYDRPDTGKVDTLTCGRMPYRKDGERGGREEEAEREREAMTRVELESIIMIKSIKDAIVN
ncbi:hypothetical protein BHM03_00048028 [Ensete ventricosum]|nr:hypothetical protein BHM03_00048028 [Ensete ventricosum]